jgi:hypothetical protein
VCNGRCELRLIGMEKTITSSGKNCVNCFWRSCNICWAKRNVLVVLLRLLFLQQQVSGTAESPSIMKKGYCYSLLISVLINSQMYTMFILIEIRTIGTPHDNFLTLMGMPTKLVRNNGVCLFPDSMNTRYWAESIHCLRCSQECDQRSHAHN